MCIRDSAGAGADAGGDGSDAGPGAGAAGSGRWLVAMALLFGRQSATHNALDGGKKYPFYFEIN